MAYERYVASSVMIKSPEQQYRDNFQALIDQQINVAYNWFDIEVEDVLGTQIYRSTKVRMSYAINPGTGTKLSDDWKSLLFQTPSDKNIKMGKRFRYGNNIWLTINTEAYGSATENCVMRRCNNTLNVLLSDGSIHKEPCAIDNDVKYGNIYYNNAVNVAQGTIVVWVQFNNFTRNMNINDRFILGYNQVYKIKNIINYLSDFTFDPDGSPLVKMEMQLDSKVSTDDFTKRVTSSTSVVMFDSDDKILINPSLDSISQGDTATFTCYKYHDDVIKNNTFVFTIVDTGIPTSNYDLTTIDGNTFSVKNNAKYLKSKLNILCKDSTDNTFFITYLIELGGVY